MNKKIAELTLETVIIAAILLILAAIIISTVITKSKPIEQGFLDCESKQGSCEYKDSITCISAGGTPMPTFKCKDTTKACCYKK